VLPLPALPADLVFLATYFVDNGEAGAYLAVSEDGYTFRPIVEPNVPLLKPAVGPDKLMRDPCLLRGPDKRWHLVWTTGWWDRHIGIAHSPDLVHWTDQKTVPVMEAFPKAINAWAPEMVFDAKAGEYVLFWSSTIQGSYQSTERADGDLGKGRVPLNPRFYATTTRDFVTYTPTRLLWDPGFNCIDATMLPIKDGWLMVGKDETKAPSAHKWLFSATAPSPSGPFKMLSQQISGGYWAEGPTAVRLRDTLRVYFDRYVDDRWDAIESTDGKTWSATQQPVQMPRGAMHGTVLLVERTTVDDLRRALRRRSK
jgi:hypothetical protein